MTDAAPARAVGKTIARNTAYNAGGRLWEALVNLLLTAYIVPKVGLAAYGTWALVGLFTSYFTLLDFGLGSGFSKYIAQYAAKRDTPALSAIVSTGFFFYLVLGFAIVAVGWPCIDGLIRLIGVFYPGAALDSANAATVAEVRFLLRWGLVLYAASTPVAAFSSIQTGLQRMGVTNAISVASSLLKVAATVVFLERGHGVRGLLYTNGVVFAFFAVACVISAFWLAPHLRVSPGRITRRAFGELFSYGWRTQVAKLSNLILFQTDKAVVFAAYGALGLVGVYRIGEELAGKMRQAPALLLSAIIPAASDLDARGDDERLRRLYVLSSKYVAALTVPLVAYLGGAAGPLIRTWVGDIDGVDTAAWVMRILVASYLANVIPGAGVSVALGKGRPDVQMKAGIIATVGNIGFTLALLLTVGFYGISLGTSLAMALSCAWFLRAMGPVAGVGAVEILRLSLLWPAVASLPGLAGCIAGELLSTGMTGRLPNAAVAAGCAVFFAASYLTLIRYTPFLDAFDVDFLANMLRLKRVPGFSAYVRRIGRA
ncbi:MAG TPA: oligosaccharide flippase family protein [Candidatus Bathyarchaeia archaeon]|nr:oligosaccharide flippase family protein [Candidatus Bathyarchaeia archaeon]